MKTVNVLAKAHHDVFPKVGQSSRSGKKSAT
jgi:hypothetical protein